MSTTQNRRTHVKPAAAPKKKTKVEKTYTPEPVKRIQTAEGWKRNMVRMRTGTRSK